MAQLNSLLVTGDARFLNSVTATTQASGDNSTKVATTAYVDAAVGSIVDTNSTFTFTLYGVPSASLTTANTDITRYSSATVAEIKAAADAGKFIFCEVLEASTPGYYGLSLEAIPTITSLAIGLALITGGKRYAIAVDAANNKILSVAWGSKAYPTSIATSYNTNQLTLANNTKYALTAGGSSFVFTTPQGLTYSDKFTNASSASNMPVHSYYYDTSTGELTIKLDSSDMGDASRLWVTMVDEESPETVVFEASVSLVSEGILLYPMLSSHWISPINTCMHKDDTTVYMLFNYIYTMESYIRNIIRSTNPLTRLKDEYDGHDVSFYIYVTN